MRILWCEEHGQAETGEGLCLLKIWDIQENGVATDCRMVPMRLIPDNEETVKRIARIIHHGSGTESPRMSWDELKSWQDKYLQIAAQVLAALDGETP